MTVSSAHNELPSNYIKYTIIFSLQWKRSPVWPKAIFRTKSVVCFSNKDIRNWTFRGWCELPDWPYLSCSSQSKTLVWEKNSRGIHLQEWKHIVVYSTDSNGDRSKYNHLENGGLILPSPPTVCACVSLFSVNLSLNAGKCQVWYFFHI